MGAYIIRRLLLMIPTVLGIMAVSFLITQFAPGGPVEQALANLSGQNAGISERITGSEAGDFAAQPGQGDKSAYRGSQGLPPELVARIEKQFGFDKPPLERFLTMMGNYLRFDFGGVDGKTNVLHGHVANRFRLTRDLVDFDLHQMDGEPRGALANRRRSRAVDRFVTSRKTHCPARDLFQGKTRTRYAAHAHRAIDDFQVIH